MDFIEKKCPNCMAQLKVDCNLETAVCQYCKTTILVKRTPPQSEMFEVFSEDLANNLANQISQKMKPRKSVAKKVIMTVIITIFSIIFLFVACGLLGVFDRPASTLPATTPGRPGDSRVWAEDHDQVYVYMPGESFVFDNFEVTVFDDHIEFFEICRDFYGPESPLHGRFGVFLPITITNLLDETRRFAHNSVHVYAPDGLRQYRGFLTREHRERRIDRVGNFRGGATSDDRYVHLLYDGDGYYYITFRHWSGTEATREVRIWIEK